MARKPLIAGNWKMYHGGARGIALARGIADGLSSGGGVSGVTVVVAPPFTALGAVAAELEQAGSSVEVSAQNLYPTTSFTTRPATSVRRKSRPLAR